MMIYSLKQTSPKPPEDRQTLVRQPVERPLSFPHPHSTANLKPPMKPIISNHQASSQSTKPGIVDIRIDVIKPLACIVTSKPLIDLVAYPEGRHPLFGSKVESVESKSEPFWLANQ